MGVVRVRVTLAAVTATAAVATVLVATMPALRFAYHRPAFHVALETTAALVAGLGSYLVFGRFHRSRSLADLLLACGLVSIAVSNLVFGALPAALAGPNADLSLTWAALAGRTLGTALIAAAAFAPQRPTRLGGVAFALVLLVLAAAGTLCLVFADALPSSVRPQDALGTSRPHLVGHPALLGTQLFAAALYAAAAFGFARRGARTHDALTNWLAIACVLGAFSRVNYFLYPSLYTGWVYTGDAFRLLFDVAILAAAAQEIRRYWEMQAQAAVLEERRRIARNLHDGLAQELAYVRRNVRLLDTTDETVERVADAADRALSESRQAIAALTQSLDTPFETALAQTAGDVAERFGARLRLDVRSGVAVTPEQREALTRIACEAVRNAVRHGGVRTVRLHLSGGDRIKLRVVDEGAGFDPERARSGYGLVSMRDRALALGGSFDVHSSPGAGTSVEVTV